MIPKDFKKSNPVPISYAQITPYVEISRNFFTVVTASLQLRTYVFTGGDALRGPLHRARYTYHPTIMDETYDPPRPYPDGYYQFPACYSDRSNYFKGTRKAYDVTINGNVEICFFFCFDVVNAWLVPWGVDK